MRNMLRYSGMEVSLAHLPGRWIALVLRGAVAIAAGIAALVVSAAAAKTVLALYLAVDGVLTLNLAAHMGTRRRARALIAIDGVADLAAAATEFLLLAIDPYPRKPGAVFDLPNAGETGAHPFAALAALKKQPKES
jgi:uncharacterized membrane protein HdeD (DUF308 family)